MNFERIDEWHLRARVFGGWIVKSVEPVSHIMCDGGGIQDGWDFRASICFVPDPNHEWTLEEKKKEINKN